MNDMPTAVIRGASLGAPRNGRYATRSIITLRLPLVSIATSSDASRPMTSPTIAVCSVSPITPQNQAAVTSEPIMKTSPCAKLISSMMP
jgi:hypothetical protein